MTCVPADGFEICERNMFLIAPVVKEGGRVWWWKTKQRKWRKRRGDMCRVEYTGTAASITAARKSDQAWVAALACLYDQRVDRLAIKMTGEWPEFSPWETST